MAENKQAPQALEGLRVVELPSLDRMPILAAAMAGKAFADHGADVIKVEPPKVGAYERHEGPFRGDKRDPETGGLHLYLNTNKLGVTLDITSEKGRELLARILDSADIVFNPNMPALNEQLGLDWRTLTARFPKLVVVSFTSFGTDSAYRDLRGGNLVTTHMSGVGFETPLSQVTDPPNHPPLKPAERQADYLTGFAGAAGAMCAIYHRKRTGAGQHVDASLWLSMVSMIRPSIGVYTHDTPDAPWGVRIRTRKKVGVQWVYPCKDGWVSFSPLTDRFWQGTKHIMGYPEWAESEMFKTLISRAENYDAVEAMLVGWLANENKQEVFVKAQEQHVPCFPVHTPGEVAHNRQYEDRKFFVDSEHPAAGKVRMPGAACMFSRTPWRIVRGAPLLGEHNRKIFADGLGLSDGEIESLSTEGVI